VNQKRQASPGANLAREMRVQRGEELRALRKDAGLNQGELARRIGIDQAMVSRIESGAKPASMATEVAWLYACGNALYEGIDGIAARDLVLDLTTAHADVALALAATLRDVPSMKRTILEFLTTVRAAGRNLTERHDE